MAFIQGALIFSYPFLLFWGLPRFGVRSTAAALLLLVVLQSTLRWLSRRTLHSPRKSTAAPWAVPTVSAVVLLASATSNDPRFMLLVPALINLGLLMTFGSSLLGEVSLVERFASWYVADLRPAERRYCRGVTRVWCAFFFLNGAVAAVTALWAPLSWWSLYNGVIAYVLMGLIFAVEFVIRKYRFRRFGAMFYDRWLMQVLPEPTLAQSAATRDGANTVNIRVHVPAGSRHFAGHFPNRPILAGVVQLTEIILPAVEQTWTDLGPLIQIKRVKFKALIGPNEDLQVRIDRAADEVRFRIMRDEQECAVGVLEFANR